jgi:hypothetical protein
VLLLPAGASARPGVPHASITPTILGTLGANGWYVTNVTVNWVLDPTPLMSQGCDAVTLVTDTPDTALTCSADFPGGTHISVTIHIRRDATPPSVSAVPARAPDSNGWYNQPLAVGFAGTDVTSGIESCSQGSYAGPDNPNASVAGFCRDVAGNVSMASLALKYDATAPSLGALTVKPGNRLAQLRWKAPADASSVELLRIPGLKGRAQSVIFRGTASAKGYVDRGLRAGRKYQYRLTATDVAANQSTKTLDFLARGALLYPAPGARVSKPPLLVWARVRGATYYNVVLVRRRRVYSAWPVRNRLQLPRTWSYRGRRYKLRPGLYRWFVWPGRGALAQGRYGSLLGGSTFTFGGSG